MPTRILAALAFAVAMAAPPAEARTPASHPEPVTAAAFVQQAARFDAYEIKAGQMALATSHNAGIKAFARRMMAAHRHNAEALDAVLAGAHSSLKPGAFVAGAHGAEINELAAVAGADFDDAYKAQQIDTHRAAVRLYSEYAAHGRSRALRAFAAAAVPILKHHLVLSGQLLGR